MAATVGELPRPLFRAIKKTQSPPLKALHCLSKVTEHPAVIKRGLGASAESSGLQRQVTALAQQRDNLGSGIQAIQDQGLRQIKKASSQVTKQLDSFVTKAVEIGRLRAEAFDHTVRSKAARLIRSGIPDDWTGMPAEVVQHFLVGILKWVQSEGHDTKMHPPLAVTKPNPRLKYTSLSPSELLIGCSTVYSPKTNGILMLPLGKLLSLRSSVTNSNASNTKLQCWL